MTKLSCIGIVYVPYGETLKEVADRLYKKGPEYLKRKWEGKYYSSGPFAVHGDNYELFNEE